MRKLITKLLFMGFALLTLTGYSLEITSKRPILIVRKGKTWEHAQSVRLLTYHLETISSRPVKNSFEEPTDTNSTVIYLGRTDYVEKNFKEKLNQLPGDEAFIIESRGNILVLAGKRPAGTLNAAVEFLRLYCGVEQYIPGSTGTVYTKKAPITLKDFQYSYNPAFVQRLMYIPCRNKREANGAQDWLIFNHRRKAIDYHHNLWRLLKQTEYGKSNPDYFSEVDGRRCIFNEDTAAQWQPCMTNPEGIKVVAEEIISQFDKNPDLVSVSIGVNDGGHYCTCKNCIKLWAKIEGPGECAPLFYSYANKIAELVAKKYPDKILGCLAYSSAGIPPKGMKLNKMIMPFVTISSQSCTSEPIWTEQIKNKIDQLTESAQQIGIYDYIHGGGMYIPFVFDDVLERTIKYAYNKGCRAVYYETGQENWGLDGYKYALAMRLLWNPELDVKAFQEKFHNDFYGPAAPAMKRYYQICRKAWERVERDLSCIKKKNRWNCSPPKCWKSAGKPLRTPRILLRMIPSQKEF